MPVKGIRVSGRNTQGVKLVQLDDGDHVCDVARVVIEDDEPDTGEGVEEPVGVAPEEEEE
jgi:DNA gyrase subunit A